VVTVWRTDKPRPVVVLQGTFADAVTDVAWAPDGYRQARAAAAAKSTRTPCVFATLLCTPRLAFIFVPLPFLLLAVFNLASQVRLAARVPRRQRGGVAVSPRGDRPRARAAGPPPSPEL
jgi:hypothetical protein